MGTATVFRRASAGAADTYRVGKLGVCGVNVLDCDLVHPVIPRVVQILESRARRYAQCLERDLGCIQATGLRIRCLIQGGADGKAPEMVVLPADDVLENLMKLGQRRIRSDDDSAPNRRLDVAERDAQRVDVIAAATPRNLASLSRLHSAAPNETRLSCGALKKDSFHNLRAPSASSAS